MFKGVLIALGIILASFLVPIAHFVLVPASPFIGGYFGISYARPQEGSYAIKGLIFGSLLGLVFLVLLVIGAAAATIFADPNQKVRVLMWIGVVIFTLYVGSMATLGAMYSALKSRNDPRDSERIATGEAE
ncbi:MAG: hypothetical protein ACE5Q6_13890 [Dehalococcoidia bacterium]